MAKRNKKLHNEERCTYAFIFLAIWGLLFGFFCCANGIELIGILKSNWPIILWSAAWATFGIASGLWSSRSDPTSRRACHYMTYYSFVWFFATALALAVSADLSGLRLYALSLVTALATGFAGDRLAGNIANSKL